MISIVQALFTTLCLGELGKKISRKKGKKVIHELNNIFEDLRGKPKDIKVDDLQALGPP